MTNSVTRSFVFAVGDALFTECWNDGQVGLTEYFPYSHYVNHKWIVTLFSSFGRLLDFSFEGIEFEFWLGLFCSKWQKILVSSVSGLNCLNSSVGKMQGH